ncbi:uncharacterized protein SETTUDRAFT_39026 [Exserohilum turcica Et28A]|uniref:Uncharacterized protein n=1 Tax=Exserohilum turcicum (strain 28A) TaxID=671987 RepID=R0KF03_EXST2|nr:uncharacterized protein SETTUDRAFT_39026 [Exserohilum turcica Et28A]EOA87899.1 hypothetical protein SETTUDRAFT_39026 [Exserohilum turcica Et28A]
MTTTTCRPEAPTQHSNINTRNEASKRNSGVEIQPRRHGTYDVHVVSPHVYPNQHHGSHFHSHSDIPSPSSASSPLQHEHEHETRRRTRHTDQERELERERAKNKAKIATTPIQTSTKNSSSPLPLPAWFTARDQRPSPDVDVDTGYVDSNRSRNRRNSVAMAAAAAAEIAHQSLSRDLHSMYSCTPSSASFSASRTSFSSPYSSFPSYPSRKATPSPSPSPSPSPGSDAQIHRAMHMHIRDRHDTGKEHVSVRSMWQRQRQWQQRGQYSDMCKAGYEGVLCGEYARDIGYTTAAAAAVAGERVARNGTGNRIVLVERRGEKCVFVRRRKQ